MKTKTKQKITNWILAILFIIWLICTIIIHIYQYNWWAILTIPFIIILFVLSYISIAFLSLFIKYIIKNKTYKGFWKYVNNYKEEE